MEKDIKKNKKRRRRKMKGDKETNNKMECKVHKTKANPQNIQINNKPVVADNKKILDVADRKTHDNLSSKFEKGNKSLADVKHKNCTGINNWERFIGEEKVETDNKLTVNNSFKCIKSKHTVINNRKMKLTNVVAIDCEMVGIGKDGTDSILARVSVVNLYGDCLYDKFVKPREKVTDYRTHVSGIREIDLKNAESFEIVQREVAALIKGRILVGHGLKNDLEVLFLSHPRRDIRDTSKFFRKRGKGTPSLKNLALEYLDEKIQEGEHSSVQDARAAVQLYNMFRKKWELAGGNRKNARIDSYCEQTRSSKAQGASAHQKLPRSHAKV